MATDVNQVFIDTEALSGQLVKDTTNALLTAASALSTAVGDPYTPFDFQQPIMSFGGPSAISTPPSPRLPPNLDPVPGVLAIPVELPAAPIAFSEVAPIAPVISMPSAPSNSIGSSPTAPTLTATLSLPSAPNLIPLGDSSLPYPTVSIPTAPVWSDPLFYGTPPDPIHTISLDEYLKKLTDTYATYATMMPDLVQSNWRKWYNVLLQDHPMVARLQGILNSYFDTGGAGIPATIETAIVTRAQDRVLGEQRRATKKVWEEAAKRGLWMPSGALAAGLKEAAQLTAEATSKVVTDVAIKNLELEHDHMKFMLDLATKLEQVLQQTSTEIAKGVIEVNGQAVEITKTVLQGMIAVNDAIVKIYLAQWEGYKAAVEKYRADIQVIEARVHLYEAQIRAELAKTEVNKAKVAVLEAIAQTNNAIVQSYKAQVEAETAKLEVDRVKALLYESQVRGFVGTVDAYRARWDGYKSEVESKLATAHVYESQVHGYTAKTQAYVANVQGYTEQVRAVGIRADAIGKTNLANLGAWTAKTDGLLRAYAETMRAYVAEWQAKAEEAKINAAYYQANTASITAYNSVMTQQQMEMGREHLTQWMSRLDGALRAAQGLKEVGAVMQQQSSAMLSGLTAFAGQFLQQS